EEEARHQPGRWEDQARRGDRRGWYLYSTARRLHPIDPGRRVRSLVQRREPCGLRSTLVKSEATAGDQGASPAPRQPARVVSRVEGEHVQAVGRYRRGDREQSDADR